MRKRVSFFEFFIISCLLRTGRTLMHDGFAKVFGSTGSVTNVRTNQLLNQLCNESQDNDAIKRDACYGCFFRSSQQPSGYPMLLSMAACADNYLNNTDYGHCRAYLRNATSALNSRAGPTTIYCTFLECVRQVNKDNLEALLALYQEKEPGSREARFAVRKTKSALILKQYIKALRGICVVRNVDGVTSTIRPGAQPIPPRRNNYIDPAVRWRGDKNVYQFYINGRLPGPAFREYDRLYTRENALFTDESDNGGVSARGRYYYD